MKFSIIIPVYNAKAYLEDCIRSVLQQTESSYEVLLVDDGSTDGESGALCDRYAAEYGDTFRVLHKKNGGAGDARNAAIPLARGAYLVFLDSDDTLEPCALARLSEQIEQTHADVYYFGMHMIEGDRQTSVYPERVPFGVPLSLEQNPELLLTPPAAWGAIWKRTLFETTDIRFRAGGWGEDLAMTRKMLTAAGSIIFLDEILYNYVIHSGSVTSRENLDCNREMIDAMQDVLDWFQQRGLFDRYRNELGKLCIDTVLYDASVRILKVVPSHPLLDAFQDFTAQYFPDYRSNPYLRTYTAKQKLIFSLLIRRHYRAVHLLFRAANRSGSPD